ncbi:MAG: DMT family transporter [Pseudomonadota bacterium]
MAKHVTSGRWQLGLALTLVTVTLWGSLPIALKLLLERIDAYTLTWLRFAVSALLVGAWLAWRGRLPVPWELRGGDRVLLLLVVLGLCGNYILYLLGLERVTPSAAQVVIQLAPLFLALGGLALFRERFSTMQWIGFALVIGGLGLYFHARLGEIVRFDEFGHGVLIVVGAAASWATYALAQKQLLNHWRSDAIMWCVYAAAVLLFLPLAEPVRLFALDGATLALLIFASLNTVVAYGCFAEALAHWEASRVSAVLAITPLLTIGLMQVLAWITPERLGREPLDALSLSGAVILVIGSALTALAARRRKES